MSIERIRPIEVITNKKPDILLINVPVDFQRNIQGEDKVPPFGLLRIMATIERSGYTSSILDAHRFGLSPTEIDDVLYQLQPKMVGVNPTSVNIPPAQEIAELCTKRRIPLIIGGIHATLDPIASFEKDFPNAYASIKGKGEKAICEIIEDHKIGQKRIHPGVYYKEDIGSDRKDYADYYPLDLLPLINQFRYIDNPLTEREVVIDGKVSHLREISLFETAGCPFECTFCATPVLVKNSGEQRYYRPSMEKIVQSVEFSIKQGANAVHFLDDMVFVNSQHFRSFFTLMNGLKMKEQFYWRGMMRASTIADNCSIDDLNILHESGCWKIAMGIESGSQEVLNRIKKNIDKDQVRRAISKLKEANISHIKGFFVMGFPGETLEQIDETRKFIMELKNYGLTEVNVFQFKPYPGTELWQELKRDNPKVLERLQYSRKTQISNENIVTNLTLPDDLMIANIPSGEVREIIVRTLQEFYEN